MIIHLMRTNEELEVSSDAPITLKPKDIFAVPFEFEYKKKIDATVEYIATIIRRLIKGEINRDAALRAISDYVGGEVSYEELKRVLTRIELYPDESAIVIIYYDLVEDEYKVAETIQI